MDMNTLNGVGPGRSDFSTIFLLFGRRLILASINTGNYELGVHIKHGEEFLKKNN